MLLTEDRKSGKCRSKELTDWYLLNSAPHTFLSLHTSPIKQLAIRQIKSHRCIRPIYPIIIKTTKLTKRSLKRLVHAPKLLVCPKQALFSSCKDKSRLSNSRTRQIRQ